MLYFDIHAGRAISSRDIAAQKIEEETDSLAIRGIYPLKVETPVHDAKSEGIEPEGRPIPDHERDGWWVQPMRIFSLVERAREIKCQHVTTLRWVIETGGITLPDGTHLLTTREDQAVITGAVTRAMLKPDTAIDFKTASGAWVSVDAARMIALGLTVSEHVEHCFSRERALHEAIDKAESVDVLNALDINTGWPGESPNTAPVPEEG